MQHSFPAAFNRDEFMAFFNDHTNLSLLSTEDKVQIASTLISKDQHALSNFLESMIDNRNISFQQLLQDRNSLPVF